MKSLRRLLVRVDPIQALQNWSYSGWEESGFVPNWRTRVADAVLWKFYVGKAIVLCLVGTIDDDLAELPWWQWAPYRAKAVICLMLGRHWQGDGYFFDSRRVDSWNGELVGYYEPEWEDSHVEVGEGWKNWRVNLHVRELP